MAIKPVSELIADVEALQADVAALTALLDETEFKDLMNNILETQRDVIESLTSGLRLYTYGEVDSMDMPSEILLRAGDNEINHDFSIQVLQVIVYEETSEGSNPTYCSFTAVDKDNTTIKWYGSDLEVSNIYFIGILI